MIIGHIDVNKINKTLEFKSNILTDENMHIDVPSWFSRR